MEVKQKLKLIAGLGITGLGLSEYFDQEKISFIGFEEDSLDNFERYQKKYPHHEVYFKDLPANIFNVVDEIYLSPGIPQDKKWIMMAREKNIKITSEIELAGTKITQPIIGVTGTNGKSTTVSLIDYMINGSAYSSALKGNIGTPLITSLMEEEKDYYVVELSSFQLELIHHFKSRFAVILNMSEDHLDRYENMSEYLEAKKNITLNQTKQDYLIYNADDIYCQKIASLSEANLVPFSLLSEYPTGGYIEDNYFKIRINGQLFSYALNENHLPGLHNQENILASLLVCHLIGLDQSIIEEGLKNFQGLPHRVEKVAKINDVEFFNDSKATNVGAVSMALASFHDPIILIMGGKNKGNDFKILKGLIQSKVKHLFLIGSARFEISEVLGGIVKTTIKESLKEAIDDIFEIVREKDKVLLSPGCASFDQYANYKERGEDFRKLVKAKIH